MKTMGNANAISDSLHKYCLFKDSIANASQDTQF